MARQQNGGWRYWVPPAGIALLIWTSGAFCGVILPPALTR